MRQRHRIGPVLTALAVALAVLLVAATPAEGAVLRIASHGPTAKKVVALTIDDGWNPATCRAIFEILERRHVPATFFPVAQAMTADRALWRAIAARGYPIGNHTVIHTVLDGLPLAEQSAAIATASAWIRSITGRAPIRVLRPPEGEWDANTALAASRAGERLLLLWDTSMVDSGRHPVEARLVRNATRGGAGSVILMHCNRPISARVLERVIDDYQARGFTFVTVPQLFGLKGPVPKYKPHPSPEQAALLKWRSLTIARLAWSLPG